MREKPHLCTPGGYERLHVRAGDRPVEILSILGREGERAHVRAAPPRRDGSG